ncbi:MAG TPA: hypothetical protein VJL86_02245 [Steroidobacteraceae bacterium]|nr:hypothetical protein [Steroidobacteraceae bacterium]
MAALIFAIAGLAGCTQSIRATGAWAEGVTRPQTFRKLLIVGVSPDYNQRCNFEWVLATKLRSESVEAITSCSLMKSDVQLSRESIEPVIRSSGTDGVVATRLVDSGASLKEGGTGDTRGSALYKATDIGMGYGYGYYGMPVVYGDFAASRPIIELESTFEVVTQVYETRGASPVYSLKTTGKSRDAINIVREDISSAIAERLRQDGLVR